MVSDNLLQNSFFAFPRFVHLYSIVDKDVGDMRVGEKLDCNRVWKHQTHTDWVTKVRPLTEYGAQLGAAHVRHIRASFKSSKLF